MNKPLVVVGDVWSWNATGWSHLCQVIGGVSIWFVSNKSKDRIEILVGEFVVVPNNVGG